MSKDPPQQERVDSATDERALRALRAGSGYDPATDPKALFDAITVEQRVTAKVTLTIPRMLHQYFQVEAQKYGMTEAELMVRILETTDCSEGADSDAVWTGDAMRVRSSSGVAESCTLHRPLDFPVLHEGVPNEAAAEVFRH